MNAERRAALDAPGLPMEGGAPVFRAPWEAQAFALAVSLHERGVFTWPEWTEALAHRIADARERGADDTGERYFEWWLAALEDLATSRGVVTGEELDRRREAWDRAARATPHGTPVTLAAGS